MTKHNDQERALFEAAFPVPEGLQWNGTAYITAGRQETSMFVHLCRVASAYDKMYAAWQARAQLPTAGGAVTFEPTHKMVLAGEYQWESSGNETPDCAAIYRAMLAAAPHSVSGEQNIAGEELINALKDAERWRFFSQWASDNQATPQAWGRMTPEKMDFMCDQALAAHRAQAQVGDE